MAETLEDALALVFEEGAEDPVDCARTLLSRRGSWTRRQLAARGEEFLADIARAVVNGRRRALQRRLVPGDQVTSDELLELHMWVPTAKGYRIWKKAADLTRADLLARIRWLNSLAVAVATQSNWHWDVHEQMVAEEAETLGELKSPLPPLPPTMFNLPEV